MSDDARADEENAAGMALVRAGRIADSLPHFQAASRFAPNDDLLANNLGAAMIECARFAEALAVIDAIVARSPANPQAHHHRGVALRGIGRLDQATAAARDAIRLRPDYPAALTSLAITLLDQGLVEDARVACAQALALQPDAPLAMLTMGLVAARQDQPDVALHWFGEVIAQDPQSGEAYRQAGIVLARYNRIDEAIGCFEQGATLPDADAETYLRLADAQAVKGLRSEAIINYSRALDRDPGLAFARAQRLHLLAWQCRWAEIAADLPLLPTLGIETDAVSPFALLSLDDAPDRHRRRSERYAERFFPAVAPLAPTAVATCGGKLRLGYFSSDFHGHATAFLAARLFELHDREQFEVHAFSYGPPVEDAMRARLVAAFDEFHDISTISDAAAARHAHALGIDIAIDLKGYTEGQRLGILAHRPAPLQLSFLGYPGTTGAPFIDYLVADPLVIPSAERGHYTERLIVLPHCYQPTDDQRTRDVEETRSEAGLPESGFIFASFNHSWKIGPDEFDCWATLLNAIEGSHLWLLASDPDAQRNLRAEIERRGIASERLLFAPFLPYAQHLSRLRHADLFLDTFRYGAHTTASDALWAGVPVITCTGRGFAARVATSLVNAIGLSELAATSREDYVGFALALAGDPGRLRTLRGKLAAHRSTTPLFDSAGFTRAIEQGYREAHRRAATGEPPADIILSGQPVGVSALAGP